jgi:DNA-binding Xre family transcriptional regulator
VFSPYLAYRRGGLAVVALCVGVGAVWLRRVLISIAEGRPFPSGNAARIAGIGGLLALASLSVLKNDRAKAIRFSTLTRICDVLGCYPGDVFSLAPPTSHR